MLVLASQIQCGRNVLAIVLFFSSSIGSLSLPSWFRCYTFRCTRVKMLREVRPNKPKDSFAGFVPVEAPPNVCEVIGPSLHSPSWDSDVTRLCQNALSGLILLSPILRSEHSAREGSLSSGLGVSSFSARSTFQTYDIVTLEFEMELGIPFVLAENACAKLHSRSRV